MNLYIRYFDLETLVTNVDDALAFLDSIDDFQLDDKIADDVRYFYESDVRYPKRYKVKPRVYFIMIKTEAKTMQDFKDKKAIMTDSSDALSYNDSSSEYQQLLSPKELRLREQEEIANRINFINEGWYECEINFKRVVSNHATGKSEYRDCTFVAQCKAQSGKDCYDKIIEHLKQRVDSRSQFPSIKGKNFSFYYLGKAKN